MSARDNEAQLLARCTSVASGVAARALDDKEANVFLLASMVVKSSFPKAALSLFDASKQYFQSHPDKKLSSADVVRQGWVMSVPRFRDMLNHQLLSH